MILHAFICVLALLILAGGLKALVAVFNAARRRATALAPISTPPPPPRFFGFPSLINIVGVALFLAAGIALSPEALAQEQVTVHYQHIPAHGIGGTLTVPGLKSGETVADGTSVTLRAIPSWKFYVYRWSHPDCTETGDEDNLGVEKTCAIAADAALSVTVTFAEGLNDPFSSYFRCSKRSASNFNLSCAAFCNGSNGVYLPRPEWKK